MAASAIFQSHYESCLHERVPHNVLSTTEPHQPPFLCIISSCTLWDSNICPCHRQDSWGTKALDKWLQVTRSACQQHSNLTVLATVKSRIQSPGNPSYSDCQSQVFSQTFILPLTLLSIQAEFPPASSVCMHSESFIAAAHLSGMPVRTAPALIVAPLMLPSNPEFVLSSQGRPRSLVKAMYKWWLFIKNGKLHEVLSGLG